MSGGEQGNVSAFIGGAPTSSTNGGTFKQSVFLGLGQASTDGSNPNPSASDLTSSPSTPSTVETFNANGPSVFLGSGQPSTGGSSQATLTPPPSTDQVAPESGQTSNPPPSPSQPGSSGVGGGSQSIFVANDPEQKHSPALKNSVFLNLGPQSATAASGESVKVPNKTIPDDDPLQTSQFDNDSVSKMTVRYRQQVKLKTYSVAAPSSKDESKAMTEWASTRLDQSKKQTADMSNIGEQDVISKAILDVYFWVAVCLAFAFFTGLVGTIVFQKLLAQIGIITAVISIPAASLYLVRGAGNEYERRMNLLYASGIYGFFIGLLAKQRHSIFHAPPSFVIPLSIAICARQLNAAYGKRARQELLARSIGPAMVVYFVCGFVANKLDFTYLFWMIVMGLFAAADLQMKLGSVRNSQLFVIFEQIQSVVAFMSIDLAVSVMFATSEDYHQRDY